MTMRSSNLLPALSELPSHPSNEHMSFRDIITGLVNTDRAMYAAEIASATSFALWSIFDDVNVDDRLAEAYQMQYPGEAASQSLHEQWLEMTESGDASVTGFINGLKGKLAEINTAESLEENGFTNVVIAPSPTQPVWDISTVNPDGENILIQVKTGAETYARDVESLMFEHPDVHYAVSSEIYDEIAVDTTELVDQIIDIGPDYLLVAGTMDGLNTLVGNLGIDMPDSVVEIIPYAGAIMAGSRLVYSVLKTEKQFKAVDRTTKNKIQVVQTLTLMSRMGVTTVLAAAGGAGGTAVGSVVPFVGNLVGGIIGSAAGAGMGMYLNRQLEPHMLDLALNITSLTHDDLFYYKNKEHIDGVALNFRQTAIELRAAPTS